MNIYQKIIEIRKSIECFTKDKKSYNYSYVSGTQILTGIKEKMDELGVVLEPHVFFSAEAYRMMDTSTDKKKSANYIVDAPMEYHWVNADDPADRAIVKWHMFGQQDDISKAFGSALTYSERYFMLKYFGIPTDELDPDAKATKSKRVEAPKNDALTLVMGEIDTLTKKLVVTDKKDAAIDAIKKHNAGKVNYNIISDMAVATAVLAELKKVEGK